ncbi:MAG: hypothetical protein CW338_09265, partial [Clostridiales bacterium]|nr:hypothetical protein [Clostridiales bacterium]
MRKISSLILILCLLAAVIPAASGEAAAMNAVAIAREAVSAVFPAMSLPGDADWTVVPDEDGCLAQCTSAEGYAVSSFIDLSEDGYAVQTSFSISIPEDAEILKIWKDWTDADGESEDPEAVRAEYAPGAINATLAYVNGLGFNSAAFSLYE